MAAEFLGKEPELAALGISHVYKEIAGAGHDKAAFTALIPELAAWGNSRVRNPSPPTVRHRAIGDYQLGAYWVVLNGPGTVAASASGSTITVTTSGPGATVFLDPTLVDVAQPVTVTVNGAAVSQGVVASSLTAVARSFARTRDLCYHRRLDCYYFPATPDLKPRTLAYRSLQQETSRDVFAVYHKTNKPDEVSHFRHAAFRGGFQRYGDEWHLQIEPTYVYTRDGHKPSRYHSELLAGIKRFDRNAAVIGQIAMWAHYLTPEASLFAEPYPHLRFGKLARFEVNRTIDDDAWLSHDDTAPEQEGSETERSLFDEP